MSDTLVVTKLVAQVVASVGVSKVINDIIVNNTNVETTADAVRIFAGSLVLGSMISDAATKHVSQRVDAIAAWNANRKAAVIAE